MELSEPLTVCIHRQGNVPKTGSWAYICVFALSVGTILERVAEAFFALWDKCAAEDIALTEEGAAICDVLHRMAGHRYTGKQNAF